MNTVFLLMARYEGLPVIPVEAVCKDFFAGMQTETFLRKTMTGEITLPVVRMNESERCAKGVPLNDLAAFLDKRIAAARKECTQLGKSAA